MYIFTYELIPLCINVYYYYYLQINGLLINLPLIFKNGITVEFDEGNGLTLTLSSGVIIRYNGKSTVSVQVKKAYKLVECKYYHRMIYSLY